MQIRYLPRLVDKKINFLFLKKFKLFHILASLRKSHFFLIFKSVYIVELVSHLLPFSIYLH